MAKTADQIFEDKIKYLLNAEKRLDKKVVAHQRKLYELILSEYMPLFEVEDGIVISSPKNDSLIIKIDNYFDKLEKALFKDVLGTFAQSLIESSTLSSNYFVALGFKKTVVDGVLKDKFRLEKKLGFTPTGKLRTDGYLYKLGKTDAVRQNLRDYVVKSLTGDVSYLDFQRGFKNLVIGYSGPGTGLSTKGSLQQYFDQYAYDSFNQYDSLANRQIARELQLKHFIYEGSTIATSRKFCIEKAGKAFSVEEAETKWPNDPNLIDKKTKASYNPLIDRGRYRCRHFIKYITETVFNKLRNISNA